MSKLYDVAQVAEILSLEPQTIRDLIAAGQLHAVDVSLGKLRPRWRVTDEALQKFIRERATVTA